MSSEREQLLDIPKELKAYINQQIVDFLPFCLPDSGIKVFVERETSEDRVETYFVTIQLSGGGASVRSTSHSTDIYEATRSAKQSLLDHLYRIQKEMVLEGHLEDEEKVDSKESTEAGDEETSHLH